MFVDSSMGVNPSEVISVSFRGAFAFISPHKVNIHLNKEEDKGVNRRGVNEE